MAEHGVVLSSSSVEIAGATVSSSAHSTTQNPALPLDKVGKEILGSLADVDSLDALKAYCASSCGLDLSSYPNQSISALESFALKQCALAASERGAEERPQVLVNLHRLSLRMDFWNLQMPGIKPFYAIKCNPDPAIVKCLKLLGAHFDCASPQEIALALAAGASTDQVIFANPCKSATAIAFARSCGVKMSTFDNADELTKIKTLFPESKLILRIETKDDHSSVPLSRKFGASLGDCPKLLTLAEELDLNVIGISFHAGSGNHDAESYSQCIADAISLGEWMESNTKYKLDILDIGGGFPGRDDHEHNALFEEIASAISVALRDATAKFPRVSVYAEPGRFFAESTLSLGVCILDKDEKDDLIQYTLNEGVFGAFKDRVLVQEVFVPHVLIISDSKETSPTYATCLIGPSGHKKDCVCPLTHLPLLEVGDWLEFKSMGAYTISLSSDFYTKPEFHHVWC
jgi:ornithine decarboxylase